MTSLGTRWLNDPMLTERAESKVFQLAAARRCGFDVPRTLLTCDRDVARDFDSQHGPSVVKSITTAFWEFSDQSFVFTTDAEEALAVDVEAWLAQPVFVQERIDGSHDVRLFVIGDEAVAACRERGSLDWRSDPEGAWTPWTPDPDIVGAAHLFIKEFGLDYGVVRLHSRIEITSWTGFPGVQSIRGVRFSR